MGFMANIMWQTQEEKTTFLQDDMAMLWDNIRVFHVWTNLTGIIFV